MAEDKALEEARSAVNNLIPNQRTSKSRALEGNCYRSASSLMVVGRALNMVEDNEDAPPRDSIVRDSTARSMLDDVRRYWSTPFTSRSGVGGYRYNSSSFWRVIKRILAALLPCTADADNWPEYLVWSNLYKLSPSTGGNPPAKMRRAQLEACIELLNLEIDQYTPRRLLLITGLEWAEPFLERLEPRPAQPSLIGDVVEYAGWLNDGGVELVVTRRPEAYNESKFTESVVTAFHQLDRQRPAVQWQRENPACAELTRSR